MILFGSLAVLAPTLLAAEKVRFSDSATPSIRPDQERIMQDGMGGLGEYLQQGGSLGGVTSTPFAVPGPMVAPSGTTSAPDEREDERKNWMFRSLEDLRLSEERSLEAFGVRSPGLNRSRGLTRRFGGLHTSLGSNSRNGSKWTMPSLGENTAQEDLASLPDSAISRPGQSDLDEGLAQSQGEPNMTSRSPTLGSLARSSWMHSVGDIPGGLSVGDDRSNSRGSTGSSLLGLPSASANRLRLNGLLNNEQPGTGSSGTAGSQVVGAGLDPLVLSPDLTEQPLNPVLPLGGRYASGPSRFRTEMEGSLANQVRLEASALPDSLGGGSDLSLLRSRNVEVAPVSRRKELLSSPTVLERPKRNF